MNLLSFDLNLLRVLDAMISEKSTVKAGERIGLSQPAVSSALRRLREHLGDPLFVRHGQQLMPTEFASELELPLRRILDELESLLSAVPEFDPRQAEKAFKLSGSDFFAEMLMPKLARYMSQHAPGVRAQLVDLVPDHHVGGIQDKSVDLALIPRTEFPSWCDFENAFRSEFVVIARKEHPRLARACLNEGDTMPLDLFCDVGQLVFSQVGSFSAMGDAALAKIGRKRHVVMTMPVFSGICSAVAESEFIALLPHQIAQKLAPRLGLSIFRPPMVVGPAQICMVWHKRNTSNKAHQWLRKTVLNVLAELSK